MVEADDELVDQEELLTWLDIGGRRSAWGTGDPNSQFAICWDSGREGVLG